MKKNITNIIVILYKMYNYICHFLLLYISLPLSLQLCKNHIVIDFSIDELLTCCLVVFLSRISFFPLITLQYYQNYHPSTNTSRRQIVEQTWSALIAVQLLRRYGAETQTRIQFATLADYTISCTTQQGL